MKIKKFSDLDIPVNNPGLPIISDGQYPMYCPPVPHPSGKKFLILGDVPFEQYSKQPFSNSSYGKLKIVAAAGGLDPDLCYRHNVFDYYPPEGSFSSEGALKRRQSLYLEIEALAPDCIIVCGANAFLTLFGDLSLPRSKQPTNLEDERGYPRRKSFGNHSCIVLPSYHPTDLFLRHHLSPVVSSDFEKAVRLTTSGWSPRQYNINFWPSYDEIIARLTSYYESKTYLSADIETRGTYITCVGLAHSTSEALVIPFHREGLVERWTEQQARTIWRLLAKVLETCPLLGQNAVHFDTKILQKYCIRANFVDDTMFAAWQAFQEYPKTLGFILSYYTDLPYHKDMLSDARRGKIDYKQEFYYCGLDCCTTLEGLQEIAKELKSRPSGTIDSYRFNINMSRAFEYCSAHGMPFDSKTRDTRLKGLDEEIRDTELSLCQRLGRDFNVNSPQQVKKLFYEEWKLPETVKLEVDKDTGEEHEKVSADYLTTLYLARNFPQIPELKIIADVRRLKKRASFLRGIDPDKKGYIYWDFTTVGTKFGRASGKKPMFGHGVQPQNVPRDDRDLCLAPDDHYLLKADLEGADSWTQAAQLMCVGEPRLMNDLLAGLKPAQALAIAHILNNPEVLTWEAAQILPYKKLLKNPEGEIIYAFCKAISHGSAYMMAENTMHQNIFKRSEGEIFISAEQCKKLQLMFFKRYNMPKVHNFMRQIMVSKGYLDYSDGSRQFFLGRKDNQTLREMLSSAPQRHTAIASNTTILRLFNSPENRDANNKLILKPINQVHDETDQLFHKLQLQKAADLFRKNCSVKQTFWGVDFIIPFEAQYGENWGNCKANLFAV
jgi:uracil-DNA glycosylase